MRADRAGIRRAAASGRERRQERVVLSPVSAAHVPPEGGLREVDGDTGCLGQACCVQGESVRDVHQRRGSGIRGDGAQRDRRLRPQLRCHAPRLVGVRTPASMAIGSAVGVA